MEETMKNTNDSKLGGAQMLEDMGQVLTSLLGTLVSGRGQVREQAKQKADLLLQRLPFVSRDEYDALHGMLKKARLEQESIKERLDILEGKSSVKTAHKATSNKKPVNEKLKPKTAKTKKSSASRNKTSPR
jgi:BMFP domain-containing protein YqiC